MYGLGVQLEDAPHGQGVAHRPKEVLPLIEGVPRVHLEGAGPQKGQLLGAFQHVGQVAQDGLHLGRRFVGGLGKGPKGGHVQELPLPKAAQIQQPRLAVQDLLRRLGRLLGQAQRGGEVVGGAHGHIAQRQLGIQLL